MNLRVRRVQEVFDMVATRPTRRRASCRTCRTKGLLGCEIAREKVLEARPRLLLAFFQTDAIRFQHQHRYFRGLFSSHGGPRATDC